MDIVAGIVKAVAALRPEAAAVAGAAPLNDRRRGRVVRRPAYPLLLAEPPQREPSTTALAFLAPSDFAAAVSSGSIVGKQFK
jgi:hypothetical protein